MHIALVTDAWTPQVNGVVTTLLELTRRLESQGHSVLVIEPSSFRRYPCPGYREIELAWRPYRRVAELLASSGAEAIHLATEGPLGWAARAWCMRHGRRFTTAFHTRFPEVLSHALHLPTGWGYAAFRHFHSPSAGVMVPTLGMQRLLQTHRFQALRTWSHGVDLMLFRPVLGADLGLPKPVFLYVGRISYEKNLDAFLRLPLPGSKVVYGSGPRLESLRAAHPQVHWRGVVARRELPAIYSAADVLVFPCRHETFGLVMLEAMACGTPVAAYPVAGPLDVIGDSAGGVLDDDLGRAALAALAIPAAQALTRARAFDWDRCVAQFLDHLVPAREAVVTWKETLPAVYPG